MVLFVLIVANIIIFGNFGKQTSSSSSPELKLLAPIYTTKGNSVSVQPSVQNSNSIQQGDSQPTIFHTTVRTRAS